MKGIKYNLEFITPNEGDIECNSLDIDELKSEVEKLVLQHYKLPMDISRNMLYNLIKRPNKANKHIRKLVRINYCSI